MIKKGNKGFVFGLTLLMAAAISGTFAPLASAWPTANNFGVADNSGGQGTHVLLPVNITNVQEGPIISVRFDILYNNSVINVVDVQKGDLTLHWENPSYFNHGWGTRISIVYDAVDEHAIQNGATGSVIVLNFSVIGEAGETSRMNLAEIQLSDAGYNVGTAPAKNGTFFILTGPGPSPTPTPTPTHTPSPTEPPSSGVGGGGSGGAIPPTDVVVSTPTPSPSATLPVTVTPTLTPSVTPFPTPGPSPTPTPAPTPTSSGFEAVFVIGALSLVIYILLRRKK